MTTFEGTERRPTKMNTTFSLETVYRIQFQSFFLKKPHTVRLKPEKLVLGAHFPPYLWFYEANCIQK